MALSFATANGHPIVSARICLPREGAWHGELAIEDDTLLERQLELNINGVTFEATSSRSNVVEGTSVAFFTAGAGGMGLPAKPRMYRDVALKNPLGDILSAAGEQLSSLAQPDVLAQQLNKWTVMAGNCGNAINRLVSIGGGATWRHLLDGTVWVGKETWDPITAECQVLLEDVLADRAVVYLEEPSVVPGRTFNGRRVSYVEHTLTGQRIRTAIWFEPG